MPDSASHLGLAERRAVKNYQDTKYPGQLKLIQSAAGFEVPVEVNWNAIARPGEADRYLEDDYWTKVYFEPLVAALKEITRDEMGATALKEHLTKITLTYDEATAPASNYSNGLQFEGGILSVNFQPYSNAHDIKERTRAIVAILEANV